MVNIIKTYTFNQFKEKSGLSRQTIYNWINDGLLSNRMFAGRRLFTQYDLSKVEENKKFKKAYRKNKEN